MEEDSETEIVGLISDTHGTLEETTIQILKQATHTIIHAGDVGDRRYKSRLSANELIERLKNGTNKSIITVSGNVDEGHADLPDTTNVTINGKKIFVMHICGFPPTSEAEAKIKSSAADICVFGHSHVPGVRWHNTTLLVNPGSAGPRRFKLPRCIAFLHISKNGNLAVHFTPVDTLPQDTLGVPAPFESASPE